MTIGQVIAAVQQYDCPLVEITGGEPLLQPAAFPLMTRLCDLGRTVLLETNGSHNLASVDARVVKIVDLKCPSSGETDNNRFANIHHLDTKDEVKFVIADRADYDWAKQMVNEHRLAERCTVLLELIPKLVNNRYEIAPVLRVALSWKFTKVLLSSS